MTASTFGLRCVRGSGASRFSHPRGVNPFSSCRGNSLTRNAASVLSSTPAASAKSLANAIISSFEQPFEIPGARDTLLGVSVDVAIYPRDGHDRESLLRAADVALYRVKRTGGRAITLAA